MPGERWINVPIGLTPEELERQHRWIEAGCPMPDAGEETPLQAVYRIVSEASPRGVAPTTDDICRALHELADMHRAGFMV